MELLIVCLAALIASSLTLFSGFGLGTLMMPVFALFFPLELAISMTAMVHLANKLFKLILFGKKADISVLFKFGLPAMFAAIFGALILFNLSGLAPLFTYQAFGSELEVSALKLVIGLLILLFVGLEFSKRLTSVKLDKKWLPVGGIISGFFGGLSGHQGAFRSMFLIKAGLNKEAFIATGVVLAAIVDTSRLVIYGFDLSTAQHQIDWTMVISATLSAFIGVVVGNQLLTKITMRSIQLMVSVLLSIVAVGLISGIL